MELLNVFLWSSTKVNSDINILTLWGKWDILCIHKLFQRFSPTCSDISYIYASCTQTRSHQTLEHVLISTTNLCCITIFSAGCILGFWAEQKEPHGNVNIYVLLTLLGSNWSKKMPRVLRHRPKSNLIHQFSGDSVFMQVLFKLTPVYTE